MLLKYYIVELSEALFDLLCHNRCRQKYLIDHKEVLILAVKQGLEKYYDGLSYDYHLMILQSLKLGRCHYTRLH